VWRPLSNRERKIHYLLLALFEIGADKHWREGVSRLTRKDHGSFAPIHRRCPRPSAAPGRELTDQPEPDLLIFCSTSEA
jgi:hypothetical protein